jgi:hypothetical protein
MDLISAVTVDFDERTLLKFQKDLRLNPKEIREKWRRVASNLPVANELSA